MWPFLEYIKQTKAPREDQIVLIDILNDAQKKDRNSLANITS